MTQIISQNNGGGSGGGTSYTAGTGIDISSNVISVDESVVQTVDNMVDNLTGADDNHYPTAKAVADAISSSGGGDMLKSVYDPNNVEANVFDYNNLRNKPTINVKAFFLASTSDLTNAQAAYDWLMSGNAPVVVYNDEEYSVVSIDSSKVILCGVASDNNEQSSYTERIQNNLIFSLSSGTVTGITTGFGGNLSMYYLSPGVNYATPYTPQYPGSPATKKYVDDTSSGKVDNTAYGNSWDGDITHAPSKDAVYDKLQSVDTSISTIEGKIPSAATSSNQLADKDYVNDSINSVTAYYITKNAQGDQWATYAELAAATTFYSGGVVRTPTKNDYTIVLADENHDNATTRYIYNSGWEYQYTVNETALTQAQLNAINSGITAAKVSTYDGYASEISGKQDALTAQTAYTSQGTSTAVPTITTNALGQVTAITETNIAFPVTSVNGGTGAVVVNDTKTSEPANPTAGMVWYDTVNNVLKVYNGTAWKTLQELLVSGTNIKTINSNSILGSGDLAVSGLPTGGTEGQILMIVSGTPTWVTPTAKGFKMLSPNSPLTVPYDWYGTEAEYSSATKSNDTEYRTV